MACSLSLIEPLLELAQLVQLPGDCIERPICTIALYHQVQIGYDATVLAVCQCDAEPGPELANRISLQIGNVPRNERGRAQA